MFWPLYNFSIKLYSFLLWVIQLLHPKAKKFVQGRKKLFYELEKKLIHNAKPLVWFHAASLGEFEQARPIIEAYRKYFPNHFILLTFFSPSGYEVRKNYPLADYICYMPIDTVSNAKKWIDIIKPSAVYFVKYEFWLNHLKELQHKKIPTYLFSAIFRPNQIFFKPYGKLFRNALKQYKHIFVQDENSYELLLPIVDKDKLTIAGDSRYDRVNEIALAPKNYPIIEKFKQGKKIFIVGSAWHEDIEIITPIINEFTQIKFIIAPHEINKPQIEKWSIKFNSKVSYFSLKENVNIDAQVLWIDNIGHLNQIYQYGQYAFIGGAYGKGLHNILEAAVFGMPLFFGNKSYQKFNEAIELLEEKGAFIINDSEHLSTMLGMFEEDPTILQQTCTICKQHVLNKIGTTEAIIKQCFDNE